MFHEVVIIAVLTGTRCRTSKRSLIVRFTVSGPVPYSGADQPTLRFDNLQRVTSNRDRSKDFECHTHSVIIYLPRSAEHRGGSSQTTALRKT